MTSGVAHITEVKKRHSSARTEIFRISQRFVNLDMAKQKFTHFIPRDKPKKRPGVHKKTQNKNEKLQRKQTRYKGQGR